MTCKRPASSLAGRFACALLKQGRARPDQRAGWAAAASVIGTAPPSSRRRGSRPTASALASASTPSSTDQQKDLIVVHRAARITEYRHQHAARRRTDQESNRPSDLKRAEDAVAGTVSDLAGEQQVRREHQRREHATERHQPRQGGKRHAGIHREDGAEQHVADHQRAVPADAIRTAAGRQRSAARTAQEIVPSTARAAHPWRDARRRERA